MSSGSTQSILARCMLDPRFLDLLSLRPDVALKSYALDAETRAGFRRLDLRRLRMFSGFVTKVQNNGLWQWIPLTRALLNYYRIELQVFVAYTATHQRNRAEGPIGRTEQTRRFLEFLNDYLCHQSGAGYPGLREVLTHERIVWEIERTPQPASQSLSGAAGQLGNHSRFSRLVPEVRGVLRIEAYAMSPLEIIAAVEQGRFGPGIPAAREVWLAYWADRTRGQLQCLELDALATALLLQVDGRRSIREIIGRAFGGRPIKRRPGEFQPFFEDACRWGLLTLLPADG